MLYYLGFALYHEKFWYVSTDFYMYLQFFIFYAFFSNWKWLTKEIAIQMMTEFLRRISLWLVPCSVGQNGLWGFCKTRQGRQYLPCLPLGLHWTILNSEFRKPATCCAHLYTSGAPLLSHEQGQVEYSTTHRDRSSVNWSVNSIDEEMLCIVGDTWATFVSVSMSGVRSPFWRCKNSFTRSMGQRSK